MKLKICGAARTVTGSSHLLILESGFKILLDCGLYQGNDPDFDDFNQDWSFDPTEIDLIILSHAHIDHSGRIPKLFKDGYEGEVICTDATQSLSSIMLLDSAYIQERDAEYINKKRKYKGAAKVKPLYTSTDAMAALEHFVGLKYDQWHKVCPGVDVKFLDAGHILGSASLYIRMEQPDRRYTYLGFTGDVGRPNRPILKDPIPLPPCDFIIMESTYGGEQHEGGRDDVEKLLQIVKHTCIEKKGKLIIPAFSVGRTQEIVYILDQLENEGKLPAIPVYVDSPLAVDATRIFEHHPECYDADLVDYLKRDSRPFGFNSLNYVRRVEDSIAINDSKAPCIIISASGMMQAGRVKHHLNNCIEDPKNSILVVGFCAEGTLGRLIRDGADKVNIFGREKRVRSELFIMDSFSAHADENELVDFLKHQEPKTVKRVFLVHGEIDRQQKLKQRLKDEGYSKVAIPVLDQEYNLI